MVLQRSVADVIQEVLKDSENLTKEERIERIRKGVTDFVEHHIKDSVTELLLRTYIVHPEHGADYAKKESEKRAKEKESYSPCDNEDSK